jgi:hypothetical protein
MNKIIESYYQSTVEIDFPFAGKYAFVEITSRDKTTSLRSGNCILKIFVE